ncbi:MAG: prepilin-type N-terminal cleavage/methylation domain-containing protein [Candidatus Saccharibacteria bacterium]|nr:prepilin-type N-terminal cleavage/methylation domain-containing protein [Candidatus Saccharibacteria bacterium]
MYKSSNFYSKGFTIVELLIVIVIIGILAALIIIGYNGIQERAESTKVISNAKAFIKGLNALYTETGTIPQGSTTTGGGYGTCIAPASAVTGGTCPTSDNWWGPTAWDSTLNQQILNYSGVKNFELGKWCNNPKGSMWYQSNYYGDNRAILQYCVGPNTDCGIPGVLSQPYSEMTLSDAAYTTRTSTYTQCMIQVFKW